MNTLESVLTCPECGFTRQETMPVDACQFFYECAGCKTLLRPRPGDCCVFCSYGSKSCLSSQMQGSGCQSSSAVG
ncbi:MAG TPA: GDCCVxC domain-containing (seleno)protein [Casimicrobiaceae bacterium]|nr:GDCCVxC domain-containing (seleno)protein [Casimicrobiaceae bacterium]